MLHVLVLILQHRKQEQQKQLESVGKKIKDHDMTSLTLCFITCFETVPMLPHEWVFLDAFSREDVFGLSSLAGTSCNAPSS